MPQVRSVLAVEFWMLEIVTVMSIPGKLVHGHSVLPCLLPVKSRWSPPPPSILMQGKWMMNVKASLVHVYCQPVQVQSQQQGEEEEDVGIICEPCSGRGWLVCDFCEGQKTNVKADNSRIYRRCPSCKAVGYLLCQKCKVFKCVTFPDYSDGEL